MSLQELLRKKLHLGICLPWLVWVSVKKLPLGLCLLGLVWEAPAFCHVIKEPFWEKCTWAFVCFDLWLVWEAPAFYHVTTRPLRNQLRLGIFLPWLVWEAPAFCHIVTRPFQGKIARGHLFAATFGEAPAFCHVIKEPFLPCLLLIIGVMVLSNLVELKRQFKTFRGSHANKTQSPQSFKMFLQPTGVLEFWMRKGGWDGGWGSFPRTEGALEST